MKYFYFQLKSTITLYNKFSEIKKKGINKIRLIIADWQGLFNSSQRRITAVNIKQNSLIENAP